MTVTVDSLGKCEHCGKVFTIQGMTPEALIAKQSCRQCGKELTPASHGMEQIAGTRRWTGRVKWVGPTGDWVKERPHRHFTLDDFEIWP